MFLRAKRKGFLKRKENELREKLAERNELSRRLTPDEDVIRIWKEANKNSDFVPGVHFGVGIEFNDKVKGNLLNTVKKIPAFQKFEIEESPSSDDMLRKTPLLKFPISFPDS